MAKSKVSKGAMTDSERSRIPRSGDHMYYEECEDADEEGMNEPWPVVSCITVP
jgi:hypothetical protein